MSKIQQQVMASVGTIYLVRVVFGATALKLYALAASVWGIAQLVWVSKVIENLVAVEKGGIASVSNFIVSAVGHAHLGVQAALLVAIVAGGLLAIDLARSRSGSSSFAA